MDEVYASKKSTHRNRFKSSGSWADSIFSNKVYRAHWLWVTARFGPFWKWAHGSGEVEEQPAATETVSDGEELS